MRLKKPLLIVLLLLLHYLSFSQNKAFVIQNSWDNDLNNYNPKNFFESLFAELKTKLSVQEFIGDPSKLNVGGIDADWSKKVVTQIKERNTGTNDVYYVALTSQLKLPTINIGKFIFKNPPRSSKLIFSYHIYNGVGTELLGDTIINRGCLSATIPEGKNNKYFYADYDSFTDDLKCHFDYISKQLHETVFQRNRH